MILDRQPDRRVKRTHGFTIIELLIVIIVIGILATLILLGYNNISKQAAVTRIKNDVEQSYKQLDLFNVRNNRLPADQAEARSVVALSDGTTLEYTLTSATSYCITTSSLTAQTNYYFDSTTRSVIQGVCSGQVGYAAPGPAVSTFAGTGTGGYVDGPGASAQFSLPQGVAVDSSGNVFIADYANYRIRKITSAGVVSTFAGNATQATTNGTGTAASFVTPQAIAIDSSNTMYVADLNGNTIRKITAAGVVTTLAGSGSASSTDGTGTGASFNNPTAVAVDSAGTVYVTESGGNRVRKITAAGVVTTIAGNGSASSNDGTGTGATFNSPYGIAVDATGNLYIGDRLGLKIRKITPAGVVSTYAGTGVQGYQDGPGTSAKFYRPTGVVLDSGGNLYVSDTLNNRIRMITPAGIVSTIAGTGATSAIDGNPASATFSAPIGIAFDASSTLYVVDSNNSKIRKITQ